MGMNGETKLYIPKVRDIVTGTVVNVTESEVLVDVGYTCEGVIYKQHITHDKDAKLTEMFQVGDPIKVKITQFKQGDDSDQLLLSRLDILKQEKIERYRDDLEKDKDVTFKVKKAIKGGLLLDYHGIEAFLPESLVSLRDDDTEKKDLVGTEVKARIIDIETRGNRERIIVNRKQLQYESLKASEKEEFDAVNAEDIVTGTVKRITDFGAFVSLGDYTEGLIHISEVSHFHVKDVTNYLEVGQEVKVKVLKKKGKRISLSLKALQETPWDLFIKNHKVGDLVKGKIVRKMQYGMLVEVEKEVVGLLNRFDYSWNPDENLAGDVEVGQEIELKITSINKDKQQFSLSKKHLEYNPWADLKFKKGEHVSAEVKRIEEKGAVMEVEGVEAFLPIGEVSMEHISRVDEKVKVGDIVTAEITDFNPRRWTMTLSLRSIAERKSREAYDKQLEENVSGNQSLHDLFKEFKK
ncbi:MAG: S1 RNA-binding domain-containing protein [Bacilli bacterium]|nr:S1 RNA-binding domain-containing protein [Bacilli bacterium]MBN2877410.1 S1 RNA-binding domain-containing protein [Bacilli bacterium]